MNDIINFFLFHQQTLLLILIGFLIGGFIVGVWVYYCGLKNIKAIQNKAIDYQQEVYRRREELAGLKGQHSQMQQQLNQQSQLLKEARIQLGQEFENLANRIFDSKQKQFDSQNQQTLNQSLNPLKMQIDDFKKQVSDVYQKESAERNQLIGKISELQSQTEKIGQDAINLALALKGDNKAQGNWGEIILERLLEESGLQKGREYNTQVPLSDEQGQRRTPDVIIYLPENKHLVIDAKVSLLDYERYTNASDELEKELALKAHINSVRSHIRSLSIKNYESLEGLHSLDFIFIFMPIEAAFMLALQTEPGLFKEAYDKQIILVSPTTLMATLRTVSNLWRYHKQHKNAEKIAQQAGGLYDQFVLVVDSLDELGGQLNKTQNSYDLIRKRLVEGKGNLVNRIEGLRKLGAKTKRHLSTDNLLYENENEEKITSLENVPYKEKVE